ncbi:thermonuclease family protein [Salmonella enterica]|jgi:micrococcal nuclease|nr:thermonuclease family protein [Salmonella enterica]
MQVFKSISRASALLFLILVMPAAALAFDGKVTRIIDGDTVEVLTNSKQPVRVRLADIDAPEKGQPFGEKSRQYLAALIFGKVVSVEEKSRDRYGRTLGVISLSSRETVNRQMVAAGYAWAYRYRGKATDTEMLAVEAAARGQGVGLWNEGSHAIEPWKWRRQK